MRKIILLLLLLVLPFRVYAIGETASSYVLMDQTTGRVIMSKNMYEPRLIASITKIMTCVLAIESNKLNQIVEVDQSILTAYGSGIYIQVGEKLTLKDLLYGLMLRSGNELALLK